MGPRARNTHTHTHHGLGAWRAPTACPPAPCFVNEGEARAGDCAPGKPPRHHTDWRREAGRRGQTPSRQQHSHSHWQGQAGRAQAQAGTHAEGERRMQGRGQGRGQGQGQGQGRTDCCLSERMGQWAQSSLQQQGSEQAPWRAAVTRSNPCVQGGTPRHDPCSCVCVWAWAGQAAATRAF